jgi:hypothetical protein
MMRVMLGGVVAWAISKGLVQRHVDNSLSYDSPLPQRIADAVRKNKIAVVFGFPKATTALGSLSG